MDPSGTFTRPFDESLIRELPHLRIAPLRDPVSSRGIRFPLPVEPNAGGVREPNTISRAGGSTGILPTPNEPSGAVIEAANAIRLKKNDVPSDPLLDPPPRPILPAFVNLRALERFPYSPFDHDSLHSRKRRRVDVQSDSFGEHLQLPIPQAQKEQRPPPFGPFAILNGLNEPPPNAALLPPIEAGSITQLLTKPSRDSIALETALLATSSTTDSQNGERREGRIADILDSPIAETPNTNQNSPDNAKVDKIESERGIANLEKETRPAEATDEPLSPKTRGRSRKNLRKWSEEETVSLLRGVLKCGIGNWKEILAQPELKFNKRSASNLKDRFRVCCPWAYRASDPNEAMRHLRDALAKALSRAEKDGPAWKGYIPQRLPIDSGLSSIAGTPDSAQSGSSSSSSSIETSQRTSEHHTSNGAISGNTPIHSGKNKPTPDSLDVGESQPLTKTRRRSRRPFTAAEDEALLKGHAVHGFQWTLIQQDKRLNLGHRRATDLRDRFRTKFPHAYREGGPVSGRNPQAQVAEDAVLKDGTNRAPGSKQNLQDGKRTLSNTRLDRSDNLIGGTSGAVDPVLPSLVTLSVARESSTGVPSTGFSFSLDENSTNAVGVDLPPLVWDDLP